MTILVTVGQTLNMKLTVLDQHGNPMAGQVVFDAIPGWTNSNPEVETIVAAADGQSATGTPIAAGSDVITVGASVNGQAFSATLNVVVNPEVQVATSIRIDATVA